MWAFTTHNLDVSWPQKAPLGGFPAHCQTDLRPIAREGCRALVQELRAALPLEQTEGKEDYEVLAVHCRDEMQAIKVGWLAEEAELKKVR
jgi:hypothetical protein